LVAPTASAGIRKACICAEWYSGSAWSGTSRSESSNATIAETYSCTSARWVSIAPLACEVVPEV
jgi:hypothetical protein